MWRPFAILIATVLVCVSCATGTPTPTPAIAPTGSTSPTAAFTATTSSMSPSSALPTSASSSPGPSLSSVSLTCRPQATDVTVASANVRDETALITSCDSLPAQPGSAENEPSVANTDKDQTMLQVLWLGSVCSQVYRFDFHQRASGYALDGTLGPGAVCFAMAPIDLELRLHLKEPLDASKVAPTLTYLHASPSP